MLQVKLFQSKTAGELENNMNNWIEEVDGKYIIRSIEVQPIDSVKTTASRSSIGIIKLDPYIKFLGVIKYLK